MATKIFEELPSRDNRDNRPSPTGGQGPTDMKRNMEKKVRQAVYDIRYRAKIRGLDIRKAYSEYMETSSLNGQERNMVNAKIFGTRMQEDYNIGALASNSVANALFKVFVGGVEKEELNLGEEYLEEIMKKNRNGETLYWVKVYYKNGTTYTRWADRARMSEIRYNPNVESVEMVDSKPPENQIDQSSKKDYDGDGKVETPGKEYRGSVHNAIQKRKGGNPDGQDTSSVKEDFDFIEEKKNSKEGKKFYDIKRKSKKPNQVTLFPEVGKSHNEEFLPEDAMSTAQQKFMGMIYAYKKGKLPSASPEVKDAAKQMSDTEAKKFASTEHEGLPQHVKNEVKEETACDSSEPQKDTRGDYAKKEMIRNRLRSGLGVKNPIVMVSDDQEVKEGAGLSVGISKAVGNLLSNPRTSPEQGAKNFQKNVADPIGKAVKGAVRTIVEPANMSSEAQKARKDKYKP